MRPGRKTLRERRGFGGAAENEDAHDRLVPQTEPACRGIAPRRPWLTIVGIGEDGRAGLSRRGACRARGGLRSSSAASGISPLRARFRCRGSWPGRARSREAYPEDPRPTRRPTCVLATGDPFHLRRRGRTRPPRRRRGDRMLPAGLGLQPRGGAARLVAARMRLRQPAWPRPGADHPAPPAGRPHPGAVLGRLDPRPARRPARASAASALRHDGARSDGRPAASACGASPGRCFDLRRIDAAQPRRDRGRRRRPTRRS